jgi:hypothetical protein
MDPESERHFDPRTRDQPSKTFKGSQRGAERSWQERKMAAEAKVGGPTLNKAACRWPWVVNE